MPKFSVSLPGKKKSSTEGSADKSSDKEAETTKEQSGKQKSDEGDEEEDTKSPAVGESLDWVDPEKLSKKPEDFQVRVKIFNAKQLSGSNIRPIVHVKIGKAPFQNTQIRKGSSPVWEKLMMFNFHDSLRNIYDFEVMFDVLNSRKLRSNAMIGQFRLNLGRVYNQPGHAYVDKYLFLTKPDDVSNTSQGFLKITICVLGAGDQPPDENEGKENEDIEKNLLTPAGATLQPATFILRVYRAEDLPQMDAAGLKSLLGSDGSAEKKNLVDPYLEFRFGGKKSKTSVIEENSDPVWDEELHIRTKFPTTSDNVKLVIKDSDRFNPDDYIGKLLISLANISSTGENARGAGFLPTFGPSFVNFYGSPREFSEIFNKLDALNKGKGEGCAYRGRALVELEIEIAKKKKKGKFHSKIPIPKERVEQMEKFLARQRYTLVVCLLSADHMDKAYEEVVFEVSIGNYGNSFDQEVERCCSTTERSNSLFDGCRYHYMPWTSKKPILMVNSQWENVNFRFFTLNFLLRLIDRLEGKLASVKQMVDDGEPEMDIASEIVECLDLIIFETSHTSNHLFDPHGFSTSNTLDGRLYRKRKKMFLSIYDRATDLRQNSTNTDDAIIGITKIIHVLQSIAYEPQQSIPDVIIWMLSESKRIGYYRIPAHDILHCHESLEHCGRYCLKPIDVILKFPGGSSGHNKLKNPCQMRIMAWLGLAEHQKDFSLQSRGQICVYADTFEMESKIPVRGWVSDGYKDVTGEISLPKQSFHTPFGWEWKGDWKVSADFTLIRDSSQSSYTEECYIYEQRKLRNWKHFKVVESSGQKIDSLDNVKCPKGWEWEGEWSIDNSRACDADGWQYTTSATGDSPQIPWSAKKKPYHTLRRKRMIRVRSNKDPSFLLKEDKLKALMGEGWEYSTVAKEHYHPMPKTFDTVRRRKWIRKMVTSESEGPTAIFNLDKSLVSEEDVLKIQDTSAKAKALLGVEGEAHSHSSSSEHQTKMPAPLIGLTFDIASQLQLRAYIYQARDLLPMDFDHYSDPVVYVSIFNQCQRTVVLRKTLNPVWDQTLIMDLTFHGDLGILQKYKCNVFLEIFDRDLGSLALMGRAVGEAFIKFDPSNKERAELKWLKVTKGSQPGGSILAAFELYLKYDKSKLPLPPPRRGKYIYKVPFGIRPVLQRTALEFLMWGVRNMTSYQLLPVNHPNVIIQLGDVVIKTDPITNAKKNPNFPKPIYFATANLPVNQLYFPPIIIRVRDNRKFGHKPTVGQYLIKNVSKFQTTALPPKVKEQEEPPPVEVSGETVIEIEKPVAEESSGKDEGSTDAGSPSGSAHKTDAQSAQEETPPKVDSSPESQKSTKPPSPESKKDSKSSSQETKSPSKSSTSEPKKSHASKSKVADSKSKKDDAAKKKKPEADWWSKYYATIHSQKLNYAKFGLDPIKIYHYTLESQETFNYFFDFIETFKLLPPKSEDDDDEDDKVQETVGEFKGAIKIYELPADITTPLPPRYFDVLPPNKPVIVQVRLYVVRGFELAPQDANGLADPYLKISSKKKMINDREHHLSNTLEPVFGRMIEMELTLPVEKDLKIAVYDWDLIGADDFIGKTVIDLENRYYSKFRPWCGLPESYFVSGPTPWRDQKTPKEWLIEKAHQEGWDVPVWNGNTSVMVNRKIYTLQSFEAKKGRLHLWVDMFPKEHGPPAKPFDISPRTPDKYVLRVIIWNCCDIPLVDKSFTGQKMSDIYVKGWIGGMEDEQCKTDVHYRSLNGVGMFNWRFIFPFLYYPQEKLLDVRKKTHLWSLDKTETKLPLTLNIQTWDQDLFSPNDYISEVCLLLTKMPRPSKFSRFCSLRDIPDEHGNCRKELVSLFDVKMMKGWWPLYKEKEGKMEQAGKVEMTIEVVTEEDSKLRPAAKARDDPNMNPKLDKPNRPATSFAWFTSPWKSFRYVIWNRYKWYVLLVLFINLVVFFIIFLLYAFPRQIAAAITSLFKR